MQECTHPCTFIEPFRSLRLYQSFSNSPKDISFPKICLSSFGQAPVCPNWYHSCDVKRLPWAVFKKCPKDGAFPQIKLKVRQKIQLLSWRFSRELQDRSNSVQVLEIGISEELHTQSGPSSSCKAAGFHSYRGAGERVMEAGQIQMPQSPLLLLRFSTFS